MGILKAATHNFKQLCNAVQDENVILLKCTKADTGEPAFVICAVNFGKDGVVALPFAQLIIGDPFEQFIPPQDVLTT